MKTSGWLYLIAACLAVLGLFIAWPLLMCAAIVSAVAWNVRRSEKRAAREASMAWPRRT